MSDEEREVWRALPVDGNESLRRVQRFMRHLPGAPRCKLCQNPFGGFGGKVVRLAGFKPSKLNPNLCSHCCEGLPPGGLEVDIAVLFADVRDSTALCEQVGAARYAGMLNQFYATATKVLVNHDAIIDKLIGDEVMALFIPGIAGEGYRGKAVDAALELVGAVDRKAGLGIGAGVAAGTAFVGNVGADVVLDFTALGDPVNTASRLQAHAAAGEVVMADELYAGFEATLPDARADVLTIKGVSEPVPVRSSAP